MLGQQYMVKHPCSTINCPNTNYFAGLKCHLCIREGISSSNQFLSTPYSNQCHSEIPRPVKPNCTQCSQYKISSGGDICLIKYSCSHCHIHTFCQSCRQKGTFIEKDFGSNLFYQMENPNYECITCNPSMWCNGPCDLCPLSINPSGTELICCQGNATGIRVCTKCSMEPKSKLVCTECVFNF
jgi:hypothetical protein